MQTDDTKGDYAAEQEIEDAMEMLGKGYEPRREIATEISGFVPVFEVVMRQYKDHITALVFGRMWQYCGMEDGVCRASLKRIGDDLEIDKATVSRHAEKLVNDGYLIDTTPDRRNRPHVYKDAGKVIMKSSVLGVAQSNTSVAQSNVGVAQSRLIKQYKTNIKKEKIKTGASAKPATPPEIKLFREVTERYPNKINYENVVALIQGVSKRVGHECTAEDLRPFYAAWCANGWNKLNLAWLSYAEHGELPSAQKKNSYQAGTEPKAFDGIRKFLEAQNVNAG